ncbi:MAG: ABC transporter substrate-binding protein, partial [Betaproteobacteria bacterium]|nr:ABC transporter substrate-binding protein [Betaproteobacteria bacterium]
MKTSWKLLAAALAGSLCLPLSAQTPAAPAKVQIGVVTALTGPMAAPGVFQMNGFKLAAEELNAAGGITVGGRKYQIELKVYDTRANPSEGA